MAAFYVKIIGSFFLFVRPKVFGVGNWKFFLKGLHHFWSYKASYIRGVLTVFENNSGPNLQLRYFWWPPFCNFFHPKQQI